MNTAKRTGLTFVFSILAIGGFFSVTTQIPIGPWVGMYKSFVGVWIAVGLALLILLILIQYSDLSWPAVFIAAILTALIVVNLSRLWGVPFGVRDPFRHMWLIKAEFYTFWGNPYPLFHIFVGTLSSITGFSVMTTLGLVGLIASTVGIGLLALVLRRLGLGKKTQQTAVVAGIPIVSAGLVARAYTLGIVFILLFIWIVTTDIRRRSIQVILLVTSFGVLWLHPVAFIVGSAVVVTAIVLRTILDRYPIQKFESPPSGWWVRETFVVVLVTSFVVHIFLFSGVGDAVIDQVTDNLPDLGSSGPQETPPPQETPTSASGSSSEGGTSSSDGSNIADGGSNGETQSNSDSTSTGSDANTPLLLQIQANFFEFLTRASLGIILLGAAAVITFREAISERFHYLTIVIGISGILILMLFIVVDVLRIPLFGARRVLTFAPILLIPVFARFLKTRTPVQLLLAVLVLTSGFAILYESPAITGGVQASATSAQVDGYRWYHNHGSSPLTGSGSTFWIAQGLYGPDVVYQWGNGTQGQARWKQRDAEYPWQATGRADHKIAISDYERARRRQQASEAGVVTPMAELEQFQLVNERIYDNGNLRFFR